MFKPGGERHPVNLANGLKWISYMSARYSRFNLTLQMMHCLFHHLKVLNFLEMPQYGDILIGINILQDGN
ncbi:hypothetical protein D3C71_1916900 [compost metagenome]